MRVTAFYQDVTRVKADIFVAGLTDEVRPPKGLVGRVDWYLGGFLSRQIIEGALKGRAGELTLVAIKQKLLTPRLLLVGLGDSSSLDQTAAAGHFRAVGGTVRSLDLTSVAVEIPPMETPRTGLYPILNEILGGFREAFREDGITAHCEIQVLSRTEKESEGWRRVIRSMRP